MGEDLNQKETKEGRKNHTRLSWAKKLSVLALAGILSFSQLPSKAQNDGAMLKNPKKLRGYVATPAATDSLQKNVLIEWFQNNTFIKVKILPRAEYTILQDVLEEEDGQTILYIPDDMGVQEFESIIKYLNEKTFGSDMPEHAAFSKIKALGKDDKDGYYQTLLESIFEYGVDSLSNIKNLKDDFIAENASWESKLDVAEKGGDSKETTKIQKVIIENIISYVHNFGRNTQKVDPFDISTRSKNGIPTTAIAENISNCITKSIIAYKLLDYYGIQNRGCYSPGHQAIKIMLDDGSYYYFDAEKFGEIIPRKENTAANTQVYTNITTPKGAINTITQDAESMIIANMLYNNALVLHEEATIEKDTVKKNQMLQKADFYLQKALDFSAALPLFWKLGAEIYYDQGKNTTDLGAQSDHYKQSVEYIENAIGLDPTNISFWEIKGEVLKKMGKIKESEVAYQSFRDLMTGAHKKK